MQRKNVLKPDGFRADAGGLLLATLVINILSLALPVMTLQVYDRILPNTGSGTLPVLVAGVCLAVFLEAVLRLCRAYTIGRAGAAYEHRMACAAMRHLLDADLARIGPYGVGEHLHRMASVGRLKDFYNGYALTVWSELAFVPVFLALIYYISGPLTAVPLSILCLFMLISLWRGHCVRAALKSREKADDRRFNFLIESLEGVHTVKSFALEKFFARRYEALEEDSCRENYAVTEETAQTHNIGAVFSHIMVAAVISFGALLVLHGGLTTGGLIAVLLLSGRMMQPIQKALSLWARYQEFTLARAHVKSLFDTPLRKTLPAMPVAQDAPRGTLRMDNVTFGFHDGQPPLLKNVSMTVESGEAVLIRGAYGNNIEALLNLMSGIYSPLEGEIHVDGRNILSYPAAELPRHVGYIRSNSPIFRGSIRSNITCFGQVPEKQARETSALLNVDRDVALLPGGFDTFLQGNSTDSIPAGLRQRIAIARVLAARPGLVIFDNADRALDREGYATVYSLLARMKGKTSLVLVSDDANIRTLADRVYTLSDDTLSEGPSARPHGNIRPYQETRP